MTTTGIVVAAVVMGVMGLIWLTGWHASAIHVAPWVRHGVGAVLVAAWFLGIAAAVSYLDASITPHTSTTVTVEVPK